MKYIRKSINEMEMDSLERSYCENLEVERFDDNDFMVRNLDKNSNYMVHYEDNKYECNCPHYQYRHVNCKHIYKVMNYC